MTSSFSFYWMRWRQSWRIAEIRLLMLAVLVSVVAVTTVAFFTERVDRAMWQQSNTLLGGDLALESPHPPSPAYLTKAAELGLKSAQTTTFASVVLAGERLKLAQVKAVSPGYPLRGEVQTSATLDLQAADSQSSLSHGEAWAEPRLFIELGIQPGAVVKVGQTTFVLKRTIAKEPDRGANAFQFAPRLMIRLDQVAETGLVTPASRVRYANLFAGDSVAIQKLQAWLKPRLDPTEKIRSLDEGLPTVQLALQRAGRFLALATLLSVIVAGAAVALASASLIRRETPDVAVMKAMGASRRYLLLSWLGRLLFGASLAALAGMLIAYLLQNILTEWLSDFVGSALPEAGLVPLVAGFVTAWIMVIGFSLPLLLRLMNAPAIGIFQGQLLDKGSGYRSALLAMFAAVFALMWYQAGELKLALWVFLWTIATILLLWLVTFLLLRLTAVAARRFGLAALTRQPAQTILLVAVFGVGLFSLLLLGAVRTDLMQRWQATIPLDAPNQFLVNIQPDEVTPLNTFLDENGITPSLYPMIRGRLTHINGATVDTNGYENPRSRRLAEREFNLSATGELPAANKIIAGQWFGKDARGGFSVEAGIARDLGFELGDSLTFDIAGQELTQTITSLREVRWESMQPNFFVIAPAAAMQNYPRTFITSIHIPTARQDIIPSLIERFPSVTSLDVSAIVDQVRGLINQASLAVQGIFLLTLIAGMLVLVAALQSQRAERSREIAILKSLGAGRKLLRRKLLLEFILLGATAGLLAGLFALIASNLAAWRLFELQPAFNLWILALGLGSGILLVGIGGYLSLRRLLRTSPMNLLNNG